MNIRLIALSAVASSVLTAATPMVPASMSTDNGGTKLAIDAYSDGGGVVIINQAGDTKFDNSAMNGLVFKYGQVAKTSNTTLKNQVSVLSTDTTAAEKAISVKFDLAKVVINPPVNGTSCDDGNPQTVSDIWTNGFCTGNNIENQLCNDGNIQTINDKYHNGVCGGTNVEGVVCDDTVAQTINDIYHNGVCAGTNVEGQTCNDNVAQTINDKYTAGICAGTNVEGQSCDDLNVQTINDKYVSGVCVGTNVEGQACNDNIAKTVGDKYSSGVCSGIIALACKEIKQATNTTTSGLYTIYPDGSTGMSAYCDMVTDGGGWTVVGNSFANAAGDVSMPFNVTYSILVNNGVGSPGITSNYFMPLSKYQQMANSGRQVEHSWYAKSANAASPFVRTLQHSNHYIDGPGNYYTWHGTVVYAMENNIIYNNVRLSTVDYDNDNIAGSCVNDYGSFGWYTTCHDAHFWSKTPDWSVSDPVNFDHNGRAVANGYSNYGPDAAGAFNTWYQLKIMIR